MRNTLDRIFRAASLIFVAAAFLSACAGNSASSFVGVWGELGDATQPSLNLTSDGNATGTDGCNRLIGSWKEDGKTIRFGGFASSRMACEGVDAWLSMAITAEIDNDGKLALFGQGGEQIGTLASHK